MDFVTGVVLVVAALAFYFLAFRFFITFVFWVTAKFPFIGKKHRHDRWDEMNRGKRREEAEVAERAGDETEKQRNRETEMPVRLARRAG